MKATRVYRSDEFGERLVIERRMPVMCDTAIQDRNGTWRYRRMRRADVATLLRACHFRVER